MFRYTVGIDEAGRGPLAGPVVASAVLFPSPLIIEGLNDSKKLSKKTREALSPVIKEKVLYGIGSASVAEIESLNILNATFLAMERALWQLNTKIDISRDTLFLIDGSIVPQFLKERENSLLNQNGVEAKAVIKGDAKIPEIMAASIIAKTDRDALMRKLDEEFPEYGFKRHKGYGTKAHIEAIGQFGLCPLHRPSFCSAFLKKP